MESDPREQRGESGLLGLYLTTEEALVLFEFLARGQGAGDDYSSIEDQAELRVLWDMQALLESRLTEPFLEDYDDHLAEHGWPSATKWVRNEPRGEHLLINGSGAGVAGFEPGDFRRWGGALNL